MLYSLYGPDTYRSRQKLKQIIEEFQKKSGSTSLTTGGNLSLEKFDAEEDDFLKIITAAENQSLFQEKKLVVIERFFTSKKTVYETLKKKLKPWQESKISVFIFWDENVGSKKEFKEFLKFAEKSQEFKELTPAQTKSFIDKEMIARKLRFSEKEKTMLVEKFNANLWGIINELDKISLGANPASSSVLNKDEKIYNFLDALVEKRNYAPKLLLSLYEAGAEEFYIFAAVVNSFRNLLLLKKYADQPELLSKIQKEFGVHPYVMKKLLTQSQKYDLNSLATIYQKLLEYDLALKLSKTKLEYIVFDLLQHNAT